jgi:hypothetical protein
MYEVNTPESIYQCRTLLEAYRLAYTLLKEPELQHVTIEIDYLEKGKVVKTTEVRN